MVYIESNWEIRNTPQAVPARSRVVDILDAQADGPLANKVCIRYDDGQCPVHVTYRDFRAMTNATAEALRQELLGHVEEMCPSVGYLASSGKDYALNLLALMALNATPVVLSPRNSTEILAHLLKESGAKVLVFEAEHATAAAICAEQIPGLKLVRSICLTPNLATNGSFAPKPLFNIPLNTAACEHTCLFLHTSGSTSFPKLIRLSNRYMLTFVDRLRLDSRLVGYGTQLLLAPLFHIYGLSYFLLFFANGGTSAFSRAKMPTPRQILAEAFETNAMCLTCLPFQLKQMAEHCQEDPSAWQKVAQVQRIVFAGANLPATICQAFSSNGIPVQNCYGATEVGFLGTAHASHDNPDCRVLTLHRGIRFSLVNVHDDTAQILIRHDDTNLATGVSSGEGFLIGDRIRVARFDRKQNLLEFEILGRMDDILIHVTGEKTNPVPLEDVLHTHPLVAKCVMFGSNRLSSCLFVELAKEAACVPVKEIVRQIKARVDMANADAPSHSRIDHDLIHILPLTKQLPVTAKGNVSRAKAEKLFQDEIRQLYAAFETASPRATIQQRMDFEGVSAHIAQTFTQVARRQISNDVSFFDQGMDSLLAVKFRNLLHAAYPSAKLTVNAIYELETPSALAKYILGGVHEAKDLNYYQKQVDSFIREYTNFPPATTHRFSSGNKINVIVTGANGSLGSFIIKALLDRPDVGTIFSFSRAKDSDEALSRIQAGFRERSIDLSPDQWTQICALPYNPEDEHLGLDAATYDQVFQSVDVIYHVAWRMDFLKGLPAFRDCIASTVNLLRISATSPRRPAFHFTSTVGAAMPISISPTLPEERLHSELRNVQFCNGYNLSKVVAEIVCYRWADRFGFPLDIHRVGQVSGDTEHGAWNTREHISLLIKAAQVMKAVPAKFSRSVAWIPVDVAAKGMVEIHFCPTNPHRATINHIANPSVTPWRSVIVLLKTLGIACQEVPSLSFLDQLKSNTAYRDVDANPLASLTDFFAKVLTRPLSMLTMETQDTCQFAPSIRNCPRVDMDLMRKYLVHWASIGFLDPLTPTA